MERSERTIAIGDIHGCSLALSALIAAIEPTSGDVIVTLGDYVDRGPDSHGVMEQLLELSGRCRLKPILGNHEEMLLANHDGGPEVESWLMFGGEATLDSYEAATGERRIPAAHLAFLESCLEYYEDDTHLFLHAGYDPALPVDRQPAVLSRWVSLREHAPGPHISGKTAIVGHTSQKSGEILDLGHLKCIDTYCYGGGWLTAIDTADGKLWQANRAGEVRVKE